MCARGPPLPQRADNRLASRANWVRGTYPSRSTPTTGSDTCSGSQPAVAMQPDSRQSRRPPTVACGQCSATLVSLSTGHRHAESQQLLSIKILFWSRFYGRGFQSVHCWNRSGWLFPTCPPSIIQFFSQSLQSRSLIRLILPVLNNIFVRGTIGAAASEHLAARACAHTALKSCELPSVHVQAGANVSIGR